MSFRERRGNLNNSIKHTLLVILLFNSYSRPIIRIVYKTWIIRYYLVIIVTHLLITKKVHKIYDDQLDVRPKANAELLSRLCMESVSHNVTGF
jgi:hypothetical protein